MCSFVFVIIIQLLLSHILELFSRISKTNIKQCLFQYFLNTPVELLFPNEGWMPNTCFGLRCQKFSHNNFITRKRQGKKIRNNNLHHFYMITTMQCTFTGRKLILADCKHVESSSVITTTIILNLGIFCT